MNQYYTFPLVNFADRYTFPIHLFPRVTVKVITNQLHGSIGKIGHNNVLHLGY